MKEEQEDWFDWSVRWLKRRLAPVFLVDCYVELLRPSLLDDPDAHRPALDNSRLVLLSIGGSLSVSPDLVG